MINESALTLPTNFLSKKIYSWVGSTEGATLGRRVVSVGAMLGRRDGSSVGEPLGRLVRVGLGDGAGVGRFVGSGVGGRDGRGEGFAVGAVG